MTELYIATGKSFAHLTENGDKWRVRTALEGKGIRSIAVDPANADVVYAGSAKYGLWKSLDRGLTWHALELPESYVYSIAVSPVDGTLYVGTEPSRLFKSMDGGEIWEELSALRSIPSAPTWSFPPKPWTSHVRWIAPNPQDPQLLLVGIELGRVMYSNDGGETWEDHRPGAVKDAHELAWHPIRFEPSIRGGRWWCRLEF